MAEFGESTTPVGTRREMLLVRTTPAPTYAGGVHVKNLRLWPMLVPYDAGTLIRVVGIRPAG